MKVLGAETVIEFCAHNTMNVIFYEYDAPPFAFPIISNV